MIAASWWINTTTLFKATTDLIKSVSHQILSTGIACELLRCLKIQGDSFGFGHERTYSNEHVLSEHDDIGFRHARRAFTSGAPSKTIRSVSMLDGYCDGV